MKARISKIQTNILVNAQTNVGKPWLDKLAQIKQKRHETSSPLGKKSKGETYE